MKLPSDDSHKLKLSHEFAARLKHLRPEQKIHAVVILQSDVGDHALQARQSAEERETTIQRVRRAADKSLPEIDRILKQFKGKRLTDAVSALGSVRVETTAAGINALSLSKHVRIILEDQVLSILK